MRHSYSCNKMHVWYSSLICTYWRLSKWNVLSKPLFYDSSYAERLHNLWLTQQMPCTLLSSQKCHQINNSEEYKASHTQKHLLKAMLTIWIQQEWLSTYIDSLSPNFFNLVNLWFYTWFISRHLSIYFRRNIKIFWLCFQYKKGRT